MTPSLLRPLAIVNADDFGLSEAVNRHVLTGFEQGIISSATAMANMPAFTQACQLARQQGLQTRIGLHFNITYGEPLSEAIRSQREFCNREGRFEFALARHRLHLSAAATHALRAELHAQWTRCEQQGIRPSHIDSHQHTHNIWPIAAIVARFAREQRVPVRLARNLGRNIGALKHMYKSLLNQRLARLSGASARFVCTPRDLLHGIRPGGPVEIICHPILRADGSLGDDLLPADVSLGEVLDAALNGHQRVAYQALSAAPGGQIFSPGHR